MNSKMLKLVSCFMMALLVTAQLPAAYGAQTPELESKAAPVVAPEMVATPDENLPVVQERKVSGWTWGVLAILVAGGAAAAMGGGGGGSNGAGTTVQPVTNSTGSLKATW